LQLNNATDEKKLEWLQPGSPEKQRLINYFATLGSRQLERYELNELKQRAFSLNQAVVERDGQIASVNQAVAECDGQIVNLNQVVAERDGQIASLNLQAVAERDGRIASLNQIIMERDAFYQQTLNHIWNSTSWHLTSPVRSIGTQWKRLRRILRLIPLAIRHGEGIKLTVGKAVRIYQNEGMGGVRRALSALPLLMQTRSVDSAQTSSEVADSKPAIPRIDFDQTRNRFVKYQKNPSINPLVKLIAFYLPQFHPFPENDEWWGKGFTEWTNVGKALPNYVGHYQPHCPIHFGYYDLRVPEVMEEQARLAKEYGIYGFSYYFYWFDGKILMDTPLEMMLANKKVNIPFCFTWANENWSRRWDGQENDVLIAQNHSDEDSSAFIRHLVKYFKDERYIRIDGKPILIIYRANIIPNMATTAKIWRDELLKHGIPGLYLISAQSFGIRSPEVFDFDASVEFPPHTTHSSVIRNELELVNPEYHGPIYSYEQVVTNAVLSKEPDYKLYRTAMLSWDNTARKQNNSHMFHGFSLLRYKQWLSSIVNKVHSNPKYTVDEKIVFVNAWNEWAEGTHLEPDQKFGYGYLQTTYDVLRHYDPLHLAAPRRTHAPVKQSDYAVILHLHYDELWPNIRDYLMRSISDHSFDLYASVTSSSAAQKIFEDFPGAYIELVENRGRDILPFIRMLKVIKNLGYTAICKIHSKRSVYRNDGDNIRDEIFGALMGSKEQVEEILSRFRNNTRLGMVAPKNYLVEHNDHNMTFDKEVVHRISSHMQINFRYDIFPAGSMFWFSPKSLEPLLAIDDTFFEIESGLADGTCAHAVERMFCQIVKDRNYTIESC
jgi:lipopolysaccharide biosynthesis protein